MLQRETHTAELRELNIYHYSTLNKQKNQMLQLIRVFSYKKSVELLIFSQYILDQQIHHGHCDNTII